VEGDLVAGEQGIDECLILFARERTVDVGGIRAAGPCFVVARLQPSARHVDRIAVNDRSDRIEEGQRVLARELGDGVGQCWRGQRSGGDDDAVPIGRGQSGDFFAADLDQRLRGERRGDGGGKSVAIHRQRAAGRNLIGVRRAHDKRAQPTHFLVQKPDGVEVLVIGTEGIRTNQLGKRGGLMSRGHALGRISWSTTGMPLAAICQAASDPASPPPITCTARRRSDMGPSYAPG
jgi:hypothetical protein